MLSVLSGLFAAVEVVVASRDPSAAGNMPALSVAEQREATLALPAAVARGRLHFVETDAEVTVRVGVRVGVGVRVRVRVGVRVRVRA